MSDVNPVDDARRRSARIKLTLLILLFAAPVVASYLSYYVFKPDTRSNYGELIEPQRDVPKLHLTTLDGRPYDLTSLQGKWVMLMVAGGACDHDCQDRLYHMRQVRLTTGKDRDRVERVWLISDTVPIATLLLREYDGCAFVRADSAQLDTWLAMGPADPVSDHIYLVDPHGHLMMRFPKNADPNRTKRDLARLLAASSIG